MGVTWVGGARSAPFCGEFNRDCPMQTRIHTHHERTTGRCPPRAMMESQLES
jgi:hypothetical protein